MDCYTDVLEGIKCLLEIVEKEGIVFLQEIPLQKSDIWGKLEKELEGYNVESGFNGKEPYICTVMISKKKENDWNKSEKQVKNTKVKDKGNTYETYYNNRCIVSNRHSLDSSVLSVHIPDVRYSPAALILWNDIIEYARTEEPDIIIGDFNTDAEDTPQWRSMKELMNIDIGQVNYYPKKHPKYPTYIEATGLAKRTRVGIPKTFHWDNDGEEQGTYVDYALVREDIANKVERYEIIKMWKENTKIINFKELSDHYPLLLEIKL